MSIFVFRFSLKCSVCRLHQFYSQCAVLLIANCSCLQHLNSLFADNNSWSLSSSFILQECESEKTKDKHLAICLRFSATAMIHIVCIVHDSRRALKEDIAANCKCVLNWVKRGGGSKNTPSGVTRHGSNKERWVTSLTGLGRHPE